MLQIHKSLSRKVQIGSALALIGIGGPALVYSMSITPEYAKAAGEVKTLSDISTMQQMTAAVCAASAVGDTNTLTDTRDSSKYTVKKMSDGNCWMTQNLRLTKESLTANGYNTPITSSDSDVSSNYALPASTTGAFSNTPTNGTYENQQIRASVDNNYGAYYSWCAATAGTCMTNSTTPTPVPAGSDATSSICPKGWKLPKGGTTTAKNTSSSQTGNDFANVFGYSTANLSSNPNIYSTVGASFASGTLTHGGTTWPAAGYVDASGLSNTGSDGRYWSRTAYSTTGAYLLGFSSGSLGPASIVNRYLGYSVRCVAYAEPREGSGNVNVSVAPTITIDATAGMTSEVEATTPATGNITARISANTPYKVLLGASTSNPGNKTSLYRRTDDMQAGTTPTYDISSNNYIPTVSGNASIAPSTVEANTNAWGISNSCNKDGSGLAYLPITTTQKEYCGSSMDEATLDSATGQNIHTFGIGISVSSSLASGTYETNVTVTGVAN